MISLIPKLRELISTVTDECIEWPYTRYLHFGYGEIRYRGHKTKSHRVAYIEANGELPDATPCVLHTCDNPPCINPKHLFVGTKGDNNRDRHRKGKTRGLPNYYKLARFYRYRDATNEAQTQSPKPPASKGTML